MSNNRSNDILVLEENTVGKDYIIADLHGNAKCLDSALAVLKEGDRLFIAGDLTDRGEESCRVISLIADYQAKHPNSLYVVMGNHELSNLDAIQALADLYEELEKINYSENDDKDLNAFYDKYTNQHPDPNNRIQNDLNYCFRNGGYWLLKQFRQEIKSQDLYLKKNALHPTKKSLISRYRRLVKRLPFIIYVKGKRPFTVVHAHMPFTHKVMMQRLANNPCLLSKKEKGTAANLRPHEFEKFLSWIDCSEFTMPTYAGHTVINNPESCLSYPRSKTFVLDVMAFKTGISLMVNHTESSCDYVGPNAGDPRSYDKLYSDIKYQLSALLASEAKHYDEKRDENPDSPPNSPSKRERSAKPKQTSMLSFYKKSEKKRMKVEEEQVSTKHVI